MMVVMKKRERVLICHNGTLPETDMPINAGDQTTKKTQNYECSKDLPNLVSTVSTVINTHPVISYYLFSVMILDVV